MRKSLWWQIGLTKWAEKNYNISVFTKTKPVKFYDLKIATGLQ
jgi:hypothetical protein